MGRPTKYTPELVTRICNEMAEGISLRKICRADDMPTRETVRVWLKDKEGFSAQYTRAREERADFYADEVIDTAKDAGLEPNDKRVRIDAFKWTACHMDRASYGEKAVVDLTGGIEIKKITREIIRTKD